MHQRPQTLAADGKIVDFDEALLSACPLEQLAALMAEAAILADVFAPQRRRHAIAALARELQSGVRDLEMGRAHARLLAAALRRLARAAPP